MVNVAWKYLNDVEGKITAVYHSSSELTWAIGFFNVTSVPKACGSHKITCIGKHQFGKAEQSAVLRVGGEQ